MELQEFLSLVLPPSGDYYILAGKQKLRTITVNTFESAVKEVEKCKTRQENVFIGLAGFAAATSREKRNITGKKCFYMDIDCGAGKPYADKKEGFTAFKEFLKASGFPAPSLIVDSGGGLHTYWVTKEVVIESEWSSIANGIKMLAAQHGFKHDAAICADSARILRVPSTFNWKDQSNPRACSVIKNTGIEYTVVDIRKLLPTKSNVVPISTLSKFQGSGFESLVSKSTQPRFMKHIMSSCEVAKQTHDTHGANDDYNQWFSMLTLLAYCEDGEQYVHPFSNAHTGYSANTVSNKWQSRLNDKAAGIAHGATTCETFHSMHPEICEACPHWHSPDRGQAWSSPLHFGLPPAKDALPWPYEYLSNGHTAKQVRDEKGNMEYVKVFDGQVTNFKIFDAGLGDMTCAWEHKLVSGRTILVDVALNELPEQRAFSKRVANSLVVDDASAKELRQMVQSWSKTIQARRGEIKAPANYGWIKDGSRMGFRHSDTVYWNDGTEQAVQTAVTAFSTIGVNGSLEAWQKLFTLSQAAQHIETEVIIAASFAAPLIAMSHIDGAILSAVSLKSGTGKTTAMRIGQSVWGDPIHSMFSLSDTPNSIFHRMGRYNNLPAMWDDLRIPDNKHEARKTVDMIYQITQGREKSRLSQASELRETASWRTLLVCSSNTGISSYIDLVDQGGSAAQHRMLEFEVSPIDSSKACKSTTFNDISDNYGHAGVAYVKWLLANYSACTEIFSKNCAAISAKLGARPEDRFTIATIAAIYTGASFAGKAGIAKFDEAGILKFLFHVFKLRRAEIAMASSEVGSENSIVETVSMFLIEHQQNTVIMKHYPKRGVGVPLGMDNLVAPAARDACVSIATEDISLRIHKKVFDDWCRSKGMLSAARVFRNVNGVTQTRLNISNYTTGGSVNGAAAYCYSVTNTPETEILFSEYL